jgi:hypothetical protein
MHQPYSAGNGHFWDGRFERHTASIRIVLVMTGRSVTGRKAVMASPGPPRDSQPGGLGRLRFNRAGTPKYRVHSNVALSEEHTVTLILYYVAFMIGGDFAAYFLGLLVEYEWGKHVSLIVFLGLYFFSLWVAWMLAVWVTTPRGATSSAR